METSDTPQTNENTTDTQNKKTYNCQNYKDWSDYLIWSIVTGVIGFGLFVNSNKFDQRQKLQSILFKLSIPCLISCFVLLMLFIFKHSPYRTKPDGTYYNVGDEME